VPVFKLETEDGKWLDNARFSIPDWKPGDRIPRGRDTLEVVRVRHDDEVDVLVIAPGRSRSRSVALAWTAPPKAATSPAAITASSIAAAECSSDGPRYRTAPQEGRPAARRAPARLGWANERVLPRAMRARRRLRT